MTIDNLIQLVAAKLAQLNGQKATATALGEVQAIIVLDAQITQTETTLAMLRAL